jgi:hypothetical protein
LVVPSSQILSNVVRNKGEPLIILPSLPLQQDFILYTCSEEFERNKKLQNNKGTAAADENNVSVTKENGH